MLISEISLRNFKSYGNNKQTLKLNTEKGDLILLVGANGSGKCVEKSTNIDININELELNDKLISYLEETEVGKRLILYIRENNTPLYDKIKNYECEKEI